MPPRVHPEGSGRMSRQKVIPRKGQLLGRTSSILAKLGWRYRGTLGDTGESEAGAGKVSAGCRDLNVT